MLLISFPYSQHLMFRLESFAIGKSQDCTPNIEIPVFLPNSYYPLLLPTFNEEVVEKIPSPLPRFDYNCGHLDTSESFMFLPLDTASPLKVDSKSIWLSR